MTRLLLVRQIVSRDYAGTYYVRNQIRRRSRDIKDGKSAVGLFDPGMETPELIEGYLKPVMARDWDLGTLLQIRAFQAGAGRAAVPLSYDAVRVPVVVVQGRYDRVTETAEVRRLAARLASRGQGGSLRKLETQLVEAVEGAYRSAGTGEAAPASETTDSALLEQAEREAQRGFRNPPAVAVWEGPSGPQRTRYVEIDRSAHLPMDETPAAVALALALFLDEAHAEHR